MVAEVKLNAKTADENSSVHICLSKSSPGKISKVLRSKEQVHLQFIDLNVGVNGKEILKNVSGEIKPGEVVAIMGPSGKSKTFRFNKL